MCVFLCLWSHFDAKIRFWRTSNNNHSSWDTRKREIERAESHQLCGCMHMYIQIFVYQIILAPILEYCLGNSIYFVSATQNCVFSFSYFLIPKLYLLLFWFLLFNTHKNVPIYTVYIQNMSIYQMHVGLWYVSVCEWSWLILFCCLFLLHKHTNSRWRDSLAEASACSLSLKALRKKLMYK